MSHVSRGSSMIAILSEHVRQHPLTASRPTGCSTRAASRGTTISSTTAGARPAPTLGWRTNCTTCATTSPAASSPPGVTSSPCSERWGTRRQRRRLTRTRISGRPPRTRRELRQLQWPPRFWPHNLGGSRRVRTSAGSLNRRSSPADPRGTSSADSPRGRKTPPCLQGTSHTGSDPHVCRLRARPRGVSQGRRTIRIWLLKPASSAQ